MVSSRTLLMVGGGALALYLGSDLLKKKSALANLDIVLTDVAIKDFSFTSLTGEVKAKINNPTSGTLKFTKPYPVVYFNGSPIATGTPTSEQIQLSARDSVELWIPITLNSIQLLTKGGSLFDRFKGGDNIKLSVVVKTDVNGINIQSNVYDFEV